MTQTSCLCGAIKLSFTGESILNWLCHCTDDRKITGSMFASNMLIKDETIKHETGTMKQYTKIVLSGSNMTSHFCGDCGTTMYRVSSKFPGHVVIKIGTIDDLRTHDSLKPQQEHFVRSRVAWLGPIEGVEQSETDPF